MLLGPLAHLVAIVSFSGQPTLRVCSLLTPAELGGVGVTLTARGLMPDEEVTVKRSSIPALPADLRTAQCTSEYVEAIGDFPVRFGVLTASRVLDRAGWDAVDRALDDDDAPVRGTVTQVGAANCERITQPSIEKGRTVSVMACSLASGTRFLTLEVARRDASQLPAPEKVAALLTLMKQRLP